MLKKVIILFILLAILFVLVKYQASAPVNNTSIKSDGTNKYTTIEYKITKIKDNHYYGKNDNGTEIIFSAKKVTSDAMIHIDDEVICYFNKNNLGKGLVKVEKK